VPIDTTGRNNNFLIDVLNSGLISQFAYDYVDENRAALKNYETFEIFNNGFVVDDRIYGKFIDAAASKNIKHNPVEISEAAPYLKNQIKAFISRQVFKNDGFYPVILKVDKTFQRALEVISSKPNS